jgi:hypothetical protein
MPDCLFEADPVKYVLDRLAEITFDAEDSICHTRDLRSSPVAAPEDLNEQELQAVESQSTFFDRFVPFGICPDNVGSNAYLSHLLYRFTTNRDVPDSSLPDAARPRVLMADVNIFERVLKVSCPVVTPCQNVCIQMQYDVSGAANDARRMVPIFLGLWHPAKQLSILIWRRFAPQFLAPLVHHIQPDSHYYMKPSFTKITRWLVMIRLAFKPVREDFIRVKAAHMTSPGQRRLAASVIELVDVYIVTVSITHDPMSMIDKWDR